MEKGMVLLKKMSGVFDRILTIMAMLAGILLIFAMASISVAIGARYFGDRPIGWVVEISSYILLYVTFLSAAWVLKEKGHVIIDVLLNVLNARTQVLINIITSCLCAAVCLVITFYGIRMTWQLFKVGYFTPTELEIPKFIIVGVIPIGSFTLFMEFVRVIYRGLKAFNKPQDKERKEGNGTSDSELF